jgi:hypothetical protein
MASVFLRPTALSEGGAASLSEGGAAVAADATPGASGRPASASSRSSRVFKLGAVQLKKLRNGDVYRVGPSTGPP